jgi:hypothetical protein
LKPISKQQKSLVPTPASALEIEALAYARRLIASMAAGGSPWSLASPFSAEASGAFIRDWLRRGAMSFATTRLQIIALARSGEPESARVLREIILEAKSRGATLPVELEAYAMELVHGGVMGHQAAGPKGKNKLLRNIMITLVVAGVVDRFGFDPTGRSPRRRSASSIVAEALGEVGINMSAKRVEIIWRDYWAAAPTKPGWTSDFRDFKGLPSS